MIILFLFFSFVVHFNLNNIFPEDSVFTITKQDSSTFTIPTDNDAYEILAKQFEITTTYFYWFAIILFIILMTLLVVIYFLLRLKKSYGKLSIVSKPNSTNTENENYELDKETAFQKNRQEIEKLNQKIDEFKVFLNEKKNLLLQPGNDDDNLNILNDFIVDIDYIKSKISSDSVNYNNIETVLSQIKEIIIKTNSVDIFNRIDKDNEFIELYDLIVNELKPNNEKTEYDLNDWILKIIDFYEEEMITQQNRNISSENSLINKLINYSSDLKIIVPERGSPFDSKTMRIISEKPSELKRGEVLTVLRRGIIFNDNIIKKSEVIISK